MKFDALLGAHRPGDPAEATLVLAAVAAFNGYRSTGEPMEDGFPHSPSRREIADELGISISAVRRGLTFLREGGAVTGDGSDVEVEPGALASRWANYRQRIRLDRAARSHGLKPKPLLVTALVLGQVNKQGQLRLGIGYLVERTGMKRRSLERALAKARSAGAIHTWVNRPDFVLNLAAGPSRSGERREAQSGARRGRNKAASGGDAPSRAPERHEVAAPPVAKWRTPHPELAAPPSRSGARVPDTPGVHTESPPDAPAPPAGEWSRALPCAAAEKTSSSPSEPQDQLRQHVEAWVLETKVHPWLNANDDNHVSRVASLVDRISLRPPAIRDHVAFYRDRFELARRIIRWCPSPERLGRWLMRARSWFDVKNLGAYLRKAAERGDPGNLLEHYSKYRVGRAGENWRDFTRTTEQGLEGEHLEHVEAISESLSMASRSLDEGTRSALRDDLRRYLEQRRPKAARSVLMKLVGSDWNDAGITRAVGDVMTVDEAKLLLGAVA